MGQGRTPKAETVGNCLSPLGRVEYQLNPAAQHTIDDVWAPFADLFHALHRQIRSAQRIGSALSSDKRKSHRGQAAAGLDQRGLVLIAHRYKHTAFERQVRPAAELRFRESTPEIGVEPHYLAGRFHLRAEDRIDAPKSLERKHSLLHCDMPAATKALADCPDAPITQLLAEHDAGSNFCDRHAGGLGDKRYGARGARIDLEDKDHAVLHREL